MKHFIIRNKKIILIVSIFIIALLFRLRGINNLLLDFHSWRQTLTAEVSKNFYLRSMNIFKPEVDIFPWCSFEPEFPLYQWIVAALYRMFGFHELFGRLFSVACSLITMVFLYFLIEEFFNKKAAIIGISVFSVSPICVYYNRAFMPESLMLMFAVGSIYFFHQWLMKEKILSYFFAVICTAGAFLVKITTLHLVFPLLFLAFLKYRKKLLFKWDVIFLFVLTLIPAFLWYYFPYRTIAEEMRGISLWNIGTDKWFSKDVLLNPDFYRAVFLESISDLIFGFAGFPFFLAGMFSKTGERKQKLFYVWFFSCLFYFLIVARGNYVHDYYQIPIVPAVIPFFSIGILKWFERIRQNRVISIATILFLMFIPIYTLTGRIAGRLKVDIKYKLLADEIKKITNPDDFIIVADRSEPEVIYYSDRKGWHINSRLQSIKIIDSYAKQGAKYYVTGQLEDFAKIQAPMKNKYKVISATENFLIFKLTS